jgi:SH3-like domain-containing protein
LAGFGDSIARVKADRTNVRAKPSYDGEVLGTLRRGSEVKVITEVEGAEGEPGGSRKWAKIRLPAEVAVWVYAPLVDASAHQVKSEVLKFRAGPGRNYSELGELKRGDAVTEIRRADDWIQIEPPPQAVAFVAATLIDASEALPAAKTPEPEVVPVPEPAPQIVPAIRLQPALNRNAAPSPASAPARPVVEEPVAPVVAPPEIPASNSVAVPTPTPEPAPTVEPVPAAAEAKPEARAVVREGVIRRTTKLQAPGYYELRSTRRVGGLFNRDEGLIDFLIVEDPEVKLERFENQRVFIHGTEWRDERWRTPVLKVERLSTSAY